MSVTQISAPNRYVLWGKSGGRCQYRGCNKAIYADEVTKAEFNQAYIAHIVADSPKGPRGDKVKSELLKDDLSNLMLLCDVHHRLIDKHDVAGHTTELLVEMKREHEERINTVTALQKNQQSIIISYRANVGVHTPLTTYDAVSYFLLPEYYPATRTVIDLGLSNSPLRDKNDIFWITELENLETQFNEQLRPKLRKAEIPHLSIFAFAPIPLLIKLGTLLNDIQHAEIYQPVRDPKTWKLDSSSIGTDYQITDPKDVNHNVVALNISMSGTINNDRITNVLVADCAIYTLKIEEPFNDFLKSKKSLQDFSVVVRKLFDKIKSVHLSVSILHIFPAMPVATAIELGRVWMPKADMALKIYDQNSINEGFREAITIINE